MKREEAVSRCWAEIDLNILCQNYESAKRRAGSARVFCVLKGNAYGLGAVEVCRALQKRGADFFAVASGDEAEELLAAFPNVDVLILGRVGFEQATRLIRQGAIFTLFSAAYGETLVDAARGAGRAARAHVKVETGLTRLGFSGEDALPALVHLTHTGLVTVEGLFTHLALHDRDADMAQFDALDAFNAALTRKGIAVPCVHALDSIGLIRYPERVMDAVRVGAWLYGVRPRGCPEEESRLTMALKARVAQLHSVKKGMRVGYDDDHFLARDSVIATLTCGYLDGVPRLNNFGEVEIRGKRAPVVGLVCMDQMMVDVTDLPEVRENDEVTLLGGDISVDEYAGWGRLNRNEALGRVGRRVTRVYALDGREWYANDVLGNIKSEAL